LLTALYGEGRGDQTVYLASRPQSGVPSQHAQRANRYGRMGGPACEIPRLGLRSGTGLANHAALNRLAQSPVAPSAAAQLPLCQLPPARTLIAPSSMPAPSGARPFLKFQRSTLYPDSRIPAAIASPTRREP
jgi:hypothetical protein